MAALAPSFLNAFSQVLQVAKEIIASCMSSILDFYLFLSDQTFSHRLIMEEVLWPLLRLQI